MVTNLEQLGRRTRKWVVYLVLGRLINGGRVLSNHFCRFAFSRARHSATSKAKPPLTTTKSENCITICVPNLHSGNNFPRIVARRFGRRVLVEEYFTTKYEHARARQLRNIDVFHLHFIDQLQLDYSETIRLIDSLRGAGVKIVLTAHDLTPHSKQPELYDPLYQAWLGAADGVIHHSQWGLGALQARYQIREQAKHAIIFLLGGRNKRSVVSPAKRARLEAALGLTAVPIRIGIFGTTRRERLVTEFLEGFARTTRDDTQVTCWSLTDRDVVPSDPRIVIPRRKKRVLDRTFRRMLAVCDVIAVPYQVDGEMLTTGFASSAVEAGIGVLRTDWPYLKEVLGDAAIPIGNDIEGFSMALSRLGVDDIERAKRTSSRLRSSHSWRTIAAQYEEFYESVLAE